MDDKLLQEFLKIGLFEIGDSGDRLEWLKLASSDLNEKFEKNLSLIPKYTLVALDPDISDTDPVMIETENVIAAHWKTLRGKFNEMPRNLIRGVIINALNEVGTINSDAARIFYLTATNFFPYAKLKSEKSLIENVIKSLGEIAEKRAIEEWSLVEQESSLKINNLKIPNFKFGDLSINEDQLKQKLKLAIEQEPGGHNAQNHGGNSPWGIHFANHASEGISITFNEALKKFSSSLMADSIEAPINKFFSDLKKNIELNLKTSFSIFTATERRSKLLWWKESLYSPSQKKSYREFDKYLLPILLSQDLNLQVPVVTPISIDYILKDTLFQLNDKKDESIAFSEYFSEILKEPNMKILKSFVISDIGENGRISITDYIYLLVRDGAKINNFKERTGIDYTAKITFGELAVVVLHDLLIRRLINN